MSEPSSQEPSSQEPEEPRLAVGAIVVDGGRLLMVKRGHEPSSGLWSIPGGHVEAGETLEEAVRRETEEETGVTVEVGQLVGYALLCHGSRHFVTLDFSAVPAGQGERPEAPRAGDDAAAVRWVPLEEVRGLDLAPGLADFLVDHGVL